MRERFENNIMTFGVVLVEFFLFLSFPDVPFLRNLFAITCGIFLFQSLNIVQLYLRRK
jgi:hypothetical protein